MSQGPDRVEPLVHVEDIHAYYGKSHVLYGVSLEVGRGEVVGLLGRNGVGKSTTLKAIMGLVRPSRGQVLFEGQPVTHMQSDKLARLGIAYVPEDRRIFRLLTVTENLRTGLDRHRVAESRKKELLDKVHHYFPVLAERRNQAGGTLSGGEQQMLAIARAMMLEPKIVLLDEPTEGLMPRMVSQVRQIIDVLHNEGVAILLVEQNVPLTSRGQPASVPDGEGYRQTSRPGLRVAGDRRGHSAVSGRVDAMLVEQILIQTVNGVVTGMILALVASGLTLIFGIMDVVNFAHGELFMLGAYVGVITYAATGDFWIAFVVATLTIAALGAALYWTTLRPLLGRDSLTTILATFGISLVLQNYALWQFGPVARKIPEPISGHFTFFYLDYPWYRLVIALMSAAIIGALWLFLKFGTFGIWIRATMQDRVMAQAMGIPVPMVLTGVFAIGSGMAAASGVLFAPLVGVNHAMGLDWVLKGFIVVVVGGMGSLGGSIAASILISLLEAYASLVVSPAQAVIVSFVVLILTLLFRPTGLFVRTPR